jgi:DHA1 family tetracycline resistance protein-like MFS transporter
MKLREAHREKFSLSAIFFTFFIDYLSWAIVFPIFAPYFLDPNSGALSPQTSVAMRTTLLGLFLAAFSLGQFFGAPFLGEYADRHGRKKALLVSVFCTLLGLAMSAWSMERDHLILLFAGRLITGFFASNATICLSCIADLNEDANQRAKYFGYLSLIGGLSFILGAFLGGKLSDSALSDSFFPSLPLWISTGLTLLNFGFILWGFSEARPPKVQGKFDFLHACRNITEALRIKKIKAIYSLYFLFVFGWTILLQFTPVLMVREFYFTNSNIGDLALFMGVCWAFGSGVLNKIFLVFFSPLKVLEFSLLGFTLLLALMIFPTHIYEVLGVVAGCVVIAGLAWPLCTALISNSASNESQGKILGMSQSVQSLATTLAPILGGLISHLFLGSYFLLGALASLIASVIYFSLKE